MMPPAAHCYSFHLASTSTTFSWPPKRGRLQHVAVFSTLSVDISAIAKEQLNDHLVAIK